LHKEETDFLKGKTPICYRECSLCSRPELTVGEQKEFFDYAGNKPDRTGVTFSANRISGPELQEFLLWPPCLFAGKVNTGQKKGPYMRNLDVGQRFGR